MSVVKLRLCLRLFLPPCHLLDPQWSVCGVLCVKYNSCIVVARLHNTPGNIGRDGATSVKKKAPTTFDYSVYNIVDIGGPSIIIV